MRRYIGPTPAERRTLALVALREHGGEMTCAQLATAIGCGPRQLTGSSNGTLFLLEHEGLVARVGAKRGVRWFAAPEMARHS